MMPGTDKARARLLYKTAFQVFPELATHLENEGVLLKLEEGAEVHLNIQAQAKQTVAMLVFFVQTGCGLEEEACFEISFDHATQTAESEILRGKSEKPLAVRLGNILKRGIEKRLPICRAGSETVNRCLYKQILAWNPRLDLLASGSKLPKAEGKPEIHVLSNMPGSMSIEFSNLGLEGYYSMDVFIDKVRQTASVTAVSGSFGRYPSYLAYPDGVEMLPHEKGEYSRVLLERLTDVRKQGAGRGRLG